MLTTLTSYGAVAPHRQAQLIRELHAQPDSAIINSEQINEEDIAALKAILAKAAPRSVDSGGLSSGASGPL